MNKSFFVFLILLTCLANFSFAQEQDSTSINDPDSLKASVRYTDKGFQFETANKNYQVHAELRLQTRIAYPYESDPVTFEDFDADNLFIGINRARVKVGGHAFRPYYKYYMEYEVFAGILLDFRVMLERLPYLKVKVGQWKAQYNRERIISSGKQQALDRSILTYAFTLDRQQGISLFGRINKGGLADFNYWASIFMGTGRGASSNDDGTPMFMGRLQWNLAGDPVPFSGSDIPPHDKGLFILALAATTNTSPYTRFSSDGGGQLDGFEEGDNGQYKVDQWLAETAWMRKGFSLQQEFHWKSIFDNDNRNRTILMGNLVQIGYFFSHVVEWFPPRLEFFARHAFYDPNIDIDNNFRNEFSVGANYFFNKHRNKLTLEYGYLRFQDDPENLRDGSRIRLQWDVSF